MPTTKNCSRCHGDFEPSSNHKTCPKCRYRKKLRPCPLCKVRLTQSEQCVSCWNSSRTSALNPRWKGGRYVNKDGYVLIREDGQKRYRPEHRLVMERHIGRSLRPEETVHHKNGIKADNNISNLELWSSYHPSGQRVEDLVEWANKILTEYGDVVYKLRQLRGTQ